jgi:predicted HicB family RNase H-like nuclease
MSSGWRGSLWCHTDTMSSGEEAESEVRVTLRMPAAVHQRAKAAAGRGRRSLNNMLVVLIELGLEQMEDQEKGPG